MAGSLNDLLRERLIQRLDLDPSTPGSVNDLLYAYLLDPNGGGGGGGGGNLADIYKGSYTPDTSYSRGDIVVADGATWIANEDTEAGGSPIIGSVYSTSSLPNVPGATTSDIDLVVALSNQASVDNYVSSHGFSVLAQETLASPLLLTVLTREYAEETVSTLNNVVAIRYAIRGKVSLLTIAASAGMGAGGLLSPSETLSSGVLLRIWGQGDANSNTPTEIACDEITDAISALAFTRYGILSGTDIGDGPLYPAREAYVVTGPLRSVVRANLQIDPGFAPGDSWLPLGATPDALEEATEGVLYQDTNPIIIGEGASSTNGAEDTVVIGKEAIATNTASRAVAIGDGATATDGSSDSVVLGTDAAADQGGVGAVSIGHGAVARNGAGVAVGKNSKAPALSVAVGENAGVTLENNFVAVGSGAKAGQNGVAVGQNAVSNGSTNIVIGSGTLAEGSNAVVAGFNAKDEGASGVAVVIGYQATVEDTASNPVVVGYNARARGGGGIAIGNTSLAEEANAIAIGAAQATASSHGATVVGSNAFTGSAAHSGVAIGASAYALGSHSTAVGATAGAIGDRSVAVGLSATAPHENAVALGNGATTDKDDQAVIAATELYVKPGTEETASVVVIHSPDGTPWAISVDDLGVLTATEVV